MTEQLTINKVTYNVVNSDTPDALEAKGFNNVAAFNRQNNVVRTLGLMRPNGRKLYVTDEYENGGFGTLVSLSI